MKQRMLGLALWLLFLSLQLLQQVGSSRCNNNNYMINVMLMPDSDFPSTSENLTSAVEEALSTIQNELQTEGKAMGVGDPSPTVVSSHFLPLFFYSSDLHQTAFQTGSLVLCSTYIDLTEIMVSLCEKRSALQIGRARFAFIVTEQSLSACFLVGIENVEIAKLDQFRPVIQLVKKLRCPCLKT